MPAGQARNPEAAKLKSYPLFDWLRFVLASLVALGHEGMPALGPIDANLAVIVFLALSGWLIGGILLSTESRELPRFFFNRATRIWTPYVFSVALIYGLAALRDGIDVNWWKYLFYDVTFTHITFTEFPRASTELPLGGTGNHFWSISVEEQFYLVAPLFMIFLPLGKRLATWILISLLLLWSESVFAAIALGVLAAIVARAFEGWYRGRMGMLLVWACVILTLALCWQYNTPPFRALFAVFLVQGLAFPAERIRVGMFFGAVSYPFYLNHWMGAFLINGLSKHLPPVPPAVSILASYAVAVITGIVTWALIDRWVMQARNSWYTRKTGLILGGAAYALLTVGLIGGNIIRAHGG